MKGKKPKEKALFPKKKLLLLSSSGGPGLLSPCGLFGILNLSVLPDDSSFVYIGIRFSLLIGFLQLGHFAEVPFDSSH